jgi:hypothetical protein
MSLNNYEKGYNKAKADHLKFLKSLKVYDDSCGRNEKTRDVIWKKIKELSSKQEGVSNG